MIWLLSKVWPVAVFASLLINEISYKGTPEWVELYNNSTEGVDLNGLLLKDANNSTKDDLPLQGSMAPYEYKVFENNKSWLNDSGDTLSLVSSSSGQIIDQISFENAVEGKTYGRAGSSFDFMDESKGVVNSNAVTPTPTKTPTTTATPTRTATSVPTSTHTSAPTKTVTQSTALPPTLTNIDEEEIEEASSTGNTEAETIPDVMGASDSSDPTSEIEAETKIEKNDSSRFQKYGYLLMIGGSVTSILGAGVGYLRHRTDGVK